jgi:hypothetical protein
MKLRTVIELDALGNEWFDYWANLQPLPNSHPPSLKNPQKVKIPTAQDGWKKGASKAARKQAMQDMVEIHKKLRRQIGRPTVSKTADYPIFPNTQQWM